MADEFFSMSIPGVSSPIHFSTPSEVVRYFLRESDIWRRWAEQVIPGFHDDPLASSSMRDDRALRYASERWQLIIKNSDFEEGDWARANDAIAMAEADLRKGTIFWSESPYGRLVLRSVHVSPATSGLLAYFASELGLTNDNPRESLAPEVRAFATMLPGVLTTLDAGEYVEKAKDASALATKAQVDAQASSEEATRVVESLRGSIREVDRLTAEALSVVDKRAEEQRNDIRSEWTALIRTYDLKLKTAAPYTYWRSKQRLHGRAARKWLGWMMFVLTVGILLVSVGIICFADYSAKGHFPWLITVAAAAIPAFVALWAARILNRLFADNQIRSEDARERAVMVKTLLALSRKTDSDPLVREAQQEVMKALFRPGPGFASDDSPPSSIFEAIGKKIGG